MKITKAKLNQIIKEETIRLIKEQAAEPPLKELDMQKAFGPEDIQYNMLMHPSAFGGVVYNQYQKLQDPEYVAQQRSKRISQLKSLVNLWFPGLYPDED